MKKTNKILALVLVLMMVLPMFSIFASAAAGETWTVAGSKALCGTEWDVGNKNNDMTYDEATDSYVKVFTNVKAGSYEVKCAKNHAWTTSYGNGSNNLTVKVEKDGSTVTITLKGTKVTATVVAPECDHAYEVTAATVTCLTSGSRTWTCSKCQHSYTENLDALGHHYDATGKCERCDETTTLVRVYVENAAKWTEVYCYTWDTNPYVAWPGEKMQLDEESGLYYYDIPKIFVNVIFNNGSGTQSADLKTPTGTATIYNNSTKAWKAPHVHAYSDPTCTEPGKCSCGLTQGDALGHEFVKGVCTRCEAVDPDYVPHVNTLVVGETNKIVVSGETVNTAGAPIEWVEFVVTEKAHYEFVGDTYAFIYSKMDLADWTACVCGFSGKADLEPGTYYICIGGVTTGEFNIAVTKEAILETMVVGENNVTVTGNTVNTAGAPIEWFKFVVTEKAHYEFVGDTYAFIYSKMDLADWTACVCGFSGKADLEPGTYYICIGGVTTGDFTINVTKTAIGGGDEPVDPPVEVEDPALALGDNTVVIDGSQTNLAGKAVAWYTFTPETAGTYTLACEELTVYILNAKNMADVNAYVGNGGVADLEAGVTYYVLVGRDGVKGEFTVNVSVGGEVVEKNTLAVGDNHYVVTDSLIAAKAEYLYLTIEEAGTYVFTGGNPMKIYVWTVAVEDLEGGALSTTTPFVWNVDVMLGEGANGVAPTFEVTFDKAGTYWVGFNYDFVGEDREFDINIALKLADEQPGEDGGEDNTDPAPQPQPEMTLIQKIIAWLMELINKLLAMFKK